MENEPEELHTLAAAVDTVPCPAAVDTMPCCKHDIAEYYSPPRVLPAATAMGMRGTLSLDMLTGWDFNHETLRKVRFRFIIIDMIN